MKVTQTQVETMRRMDVSVRAAEAAEGTSLASATGFYGTAIGPAGGGMIAWAGAGGAPGTGGTGQDGSGSDARLTWCTANDDGPATTIVGPATTRSPTTRPSRPPSRRNPCDDDD